MVASIGNSSSSRSGSPSPASGASQPDESGNFPVPTLKATPERKPFSGAAGRMPHKRIMREAAPVLFNPQLHLKADLKPLIKAFDHYTSKDSISQLSFAEAEELLIAISNSSLDSIDADRALVSVQSHSPHNDIKKQASEEINLRNEKKSAQKAALASEILADARELLSDPRPAAEPNAKPCVWADRDRHLVWP